MENPFFSIIIPTFNQGNYLKETLNSISNQTFKSFETIVVDNFSKDNTENVINNSDLNIIYKKFSNNGVIGKSRNFGLKISRGEWICFLDSDDKWTSNKLEIIYKKILKNKFDVICNSEWVKYDQQKIKKLWCYGPLSFSNFYKEMLLHGNFLATSATCIKKKLLSENDLFFSEKEEFVTCEDYDLFLNIAKLNGKFYFLDKPLGIRLIHSKSYSSKKNVLNQSSLNVLNEHISKLELKNLSMGKKIILYYETKEKLISILNERNYLNFINLIFKKMITHPVMIFKISKRLIIRYLKQKFLYIRYKFF